MIPGTICMFSQSGLGQKYPEVTFRYSAQIVGSVSSICIQCSSGFHPEYSELKVIWTAMKWPCRLFLDYISMALHSHTGWLLKTVH